MISMALGIIFIVICAILTFRIVKKGELAQMKKNNFNGKVFITVIQAKRESLATILPRL